MFIKDNLSGRITLATDNKIRYVRVNNSVYYKFLNKVAQKPHLTFSTRTETNDYITGALINQKFKTKIKGTELDLRGGSFEYIQVDYGEYVLKEIKHSRDDGFFLQEYKEIDEYLKMFVDNKEFYKQNNLVHKTGLLLYGPPGNGKTSYIRYMKKEHILPKDTIFIWCRALPSRDYLAALKKIDAVKVFIFEEIANTIRADIRIDKFLQFCDGEESISNSVVICTTNHPEMLPENLTNRPSRFNKILEFKNPAKKSREVILKRYYGEKFEEKMVEITEGLTLDQIKETFILNVTNNLTFEQATSKVKSHIKTVKDSFNQYKSIGFIGSSEEDD